ncbi:hypothetical protein ACQ4LE_000892 [Meloidogyne hapla]
MEFTSFENLKINLIFLIFRPAKLLFRLVYLLCYYGIILAGIYFIFSLYLNNQSTETSLCSEKSTNNNEINGKCKEENNNLKIGTYLNVFIQLTKVVVKSMARIVVNVFE